MHVGLLDLEVEGRHLINKAEEHSRIRLSQYEVSAHAFLKFALQESLRTEALQRATRALQGQVDELHREATRMIQSERRESIASRREINTFFDESEKKLLKAVDLDWVEVEIERAVERDARETSYFTSLL